MSQPTLTKGKVVEQFETRSGGLTYVVQLADGAKRAFSVERGWPGGVGVGDSVWIDRSGFVRAS